VPKQVKTMPRYLSRQELDAVFKGIRALTNPYQRAACLIAPGSDHAAARSCAWNWTAWTPNPGAHLAGPAAEAIRNNELSQQAVEWPATRGRTTQRHRNSHRRKFRWIIGWARERSRAWSQARRGAGDLMSGGDVSAAVLNFVVGGPCRSATRETHVTSFLSQLAELFRPRGVTTNNGKRQRSSLWMLA
jgi:hypothetical protein